VSILFRNLGLVVLTGLYFLLPVTAQASSTINGRVVGNDGKPMLMSHVRVAGGTGFTDRLVGLADPEFQFVQSHADGTFALTTDSLGALSLIFAGVGHEWLRIPLVLPSPSTVSVNVRLGLLPFKNDFSEATLLYDFDDVARGKSLAFTKTRAGHYEVDLPSAKKVFRYRIGGIAWLPDPISVPDGAANGYEYDIEGLYTTVVSPVNGRVHVVLDEQQLRRQKLPPTCAFTDSHSVQSRYATSYRTFQHEMERYEAAKLDFVRSGKRATKFSYDWTSVHERIARERAGAGDTLLQDELAIQYLETAIHSDRETDRFTCRRLLSAVSPRSYAWVFHGTTALRADHFHPLGKTYVQQIVNTHPTISFRAFLLYWLCAYARQDNRRAEQTKLLADLGSSYRNTTAGQRALLDFSERTGPNPGAIVPSFSFTSLDDSTRIYTNEDFLGSYLLMDFWATWCGPCVGEMPFLHDAYAKYSPLGLKMLSVSFDPSPGIVRYFRSTRWAMPWNNAYVESERETDVRLRFDVSFPKPMLIGPTGILLESEDALRGKDLDVTLSKYLRRQ